VLEVHWRERYTEKIEDSVSHEKGVESLRRYVKTVPPPEIVSHEMGVERIKRRRYGYKQYLEFPMKRVLEEWNTIGMTGHGFPWRGERYDVITHFAAKHTSFPQDGC
jgi:hypothetical protein